MTDTFNPAASKNPHRAALIFALELAELARGEIFARYESFAAPEVKADRSLVTEIDRAVEEKMRALALQRGYGFIGEETGRENEDAEYVVIVDPIDGTNHLVIRDGGFFSLIGVHHKKDGFIAGVADQPAARSLWTGLKGDGAFEHRKDQRGGISSSRRVFSSAAARPEDSILAGYNPMSLPGPERFFYEDLRAAAIADVPGGISCPRVASGTLQIVIEGACLWDVAAHKPIIEEAGGRLVVLSAQGGAEEITPGMENGRIVLAAANPELLENLLDLRTRNFGRYEKLERETAALKSAKPRL
jgi:fructose-1,6-bisphosphatase/inositol monophosphatase family enzyme